MIRDIITGTVKVEENIPALITRVMKNICSVQTAMRDDFESTKDLSNNYATTHLLDFCAAQASVPSLHVCRTAESPERPHVPNQDPPRPQQLTSPFPNRPHSPHAANKTHM